MGRFFMVNLIVALRYIPQAPERPAGTTLHRIKRNPGSTDAPDNPQHRAAPVLNKRILTTESTEQVF